MSVWAKLWHLLKELIGEEDDDHRINFVASLIGVPSSMYLNTKRHRKLDYCRVCALVLASHDFPKEMKFDISCVGIPRLPSAYKHCNVFGHKIRACQQSPNRRAYGVSF